MMHPCFGHGLAALCALLLLGGCDRDAQSDSGLPDSGVIDAGEIVVRTSRPDSNSVLVAVRDTGPKVDNGVIERMFDPFFTTKPEGLGMGLPISHTIIESHGGRLWATRNPERGLTVQFALPNTGS